MPITPSNPPNQVTEPNAAIPAQLVQDGAFVDSDNPLAVTISSEIPVNIVVTNLYQCITQFVDANGTVHVNDIVQEIQFFNSAYELMQTVWQDLTQSFVLAAAPPTADIVLVSGSFLTNAQLRASPVPFTTTQLAASLGAKTTAASTAVNIASDQTVKVSAVQLPAALGAQVTAASTAVNIASDQVVNVMITSSEAGLATTTLQNTGNDSLAEIEAALGTVSAQLPTPLGQTTLAESLSVTIASDQTVPVSISGTINPATIFSGQQTATATATALPSHAASNGFVVTSVVGNTATIYVGQTGITASTGYPLAPGQSIAYGVTNLNAIYILGASGGTIAFTGN